MYGTAMPRLLGSHSWVVFFRLCAAPACCHVQIMGFLETKRYQGFKETGSVSDSTSREAGFGCLSPGSRHCVWSCSS